MSVRDAFRKQAMSCEGLGSPFAARLLRLIADRLEPGGAVADRILNWPGNVGSAGASVPLRLAGTLHGLVLDGTAPELAAQYPPNGSDDNTLWHTIETALHTHEARIQSWLDSPPQTNEVRRSAALIAVAHWLTARTVLPLILSEIGASAGLNLHWDRYALDLPGVTLGPDRPALTLAPDWTGPLPPMARPRIADRRGVDLNPLNPSDPVHVVRLLSYIWPDQPDRMARTRAALNLPPAPVDRADAIDWLGPRLTATHPGHLHLIGHTVAWQYLPGDARARGTALIIEAGARATGDAPLAWFGMEADGQSPGAALTLRLWPGDVTLPMGRADFHGRWIDWQAPEPPLNKFSGPSRIIATPGAFSL